MPEPEEFDRGKYRFIIYHGHIHILAKNEDYNDQDNFDNGKIHKF